MQTFSSTIAAIPAESWQRYSSRLSPSTSKGTAFVVPTPTRWDAYSRPGGAKEMIPWYQALFGGLSGQLPPHAALISLEGGTAVATGDCTVLCGADEH
jgi:hypothetical protein